MMARRENIAWATAWGFFDAVMQAGLAVMLAGFVHSLFDLERRGALFSLLGAIFVVMWTHAALVLWAANTPAKPPEDAP